MPPSQHDFQVGGFCFFHGRIYEHGGNLGVDENVGRKGVVKGRMINREVVMLKNIWQS